MDFAQYPTNVWDGTTRNTRRRDYNHNVDPDALDWNQIAKEMIATQTKLDEVRGGYEAVENKIADFTVATTDMNKLFTCNTNANDITVTLPPAADVKNMVCCFKKTDENFDLIIDAGAEYIDEATSQLVSDLDQVIEIVSNGIKWFITSRGDTPAVLVGADYTYTTIQSALTDLGANACILLKPGSYNKFNFTAAGQSVVGVDHQSCLITETDDDVITCNYSGCHLANLSVSLTNPSTERNILNIESNGVLHTHRCNFTLTVNDTHDAATPSHILKNTAGTVKFSQNILTYTNSKAAAGQVKALLHLSSTGNTEFHECTLNMVCSNNSAITCLGIASDTSNVVIWNCNITVTDADGAIVIGVLNLTNTAQAKYWYNEIHVTGGNANDVYGIYNANGSSRSGFNFIHVALGGAPTGVGYALKQAGGTLTSHFDNLVSPSGPDGTITYVNSITDGYLGISHGIYTPEVVELTATGNAATPHTITALETNKVICNEATLGEKNYHNLPAAVAGLTYTFIVRDANGLRVTAAAGDKIRLGATITKAAGYVESIELGASITLVATDTSDWIATSVVGTWAVEIV